MNFHVIGVNHNSAPLEVRERLAVPEAQLPDAIRSLVQQPGVDEGMVLSTCNRVEVVTSTRQAADLRGFLGSYFGLDAAALNGHIYEFQQREAVRHVFRVAASLDSMVVGESQILGQVKEAYAVARGLGGPPDTGGEVAGEVPHAGDARGEAGRVQQALNECRADNNAVSEGHHLGRLGPVPDAEPHADRQGCARANPCHQVHRPPQDIRTRLRGLSQDG